MLPISRHLGPVPDPEPSIAKSISYGEYFSTIQDFLRKDRFQALLDAASTQGNKSIRLREVREIHIHLVKHGEFYHPARIEAILVNGMRLDFVLNVAVSQNGHRTITKEYQLIQQLHRKFPGNAGIPRVYAFDAGEMSRGKSTFPMFLGEWFQGFHEFHIASGHQNDNQLIVWDPEKGIVEVPPDRVSSIYEKVAETLTAYYDPITFEQIYPWHHGAGDFIVKTDGPEIDVRLITVRGYVPLVNYDERDARSILEALLVFFLNLAMQNRLDRSDGVGDIAWADEQAVQGTVKGFFSGLEQMKAPEIFSDPLPLFFQPYLRTRTEDELMEIHIALLDRLPKNISELSVIKNNLKDHMATLFRWVQLHGNG